MEFRILGPLEVIVDGEQLPPLGPKQRALLALLLLHGNEVVPSDRLIDELWPNEGESDAAALQASISRLRKALRRGGARIETSAPGYVIRLDPGDLDLHAFEQLLQEAVGVDPERAADRLREALALWRGPPLADFAYEAFAAAAIGRLEELRLLALERRIAADLTLARHHDLVPELEVLVADHPLREGFRAQLMLALYRAGRQANALEAYQAARRVLVDELGIEPAPALQALEKAILRHDPELDLEPAQAPRRSILAAASVGHPLEPLLAIAEPLSRRPLREVIVGRLVRKRDELEAATRDVAERCAALSGRDVLARSAVFTTSSFGEDTARLAAEQDVDLVLVSAPPELLGDGDLARLLRAAPCDVAVVVGEPAEPGPVLVPFAGAEHDWGAIELGAWLAASWRASLRLAGPARADGRDASRLLASASLAVQRALGVAAEPVLVEPGSGALAAAAREAAVAVVGLSDRWERDGLGPTRSALARGDRATLLVRKGLRPGGLAPSQNLTRFTWSLRAG